MSVIEAIILGILQGATEFLPVSSSGHLVLAPALFNLSAPTLAMVAIVHQGTLVAVLLYFRRDIWDIVRGVLQGLRERRPLATAESRLGWYIAVGSIPAAVAGLTLEEFFESVFATPLAASFFLMVTAVLLILGEHWLTGEKEIPDMKWADAIIIGLFQTLALFPGISRSGSTITGGLWRGLDRALAARFSFLLGIPAILGAGLLSIIDLMAADSLASQLPALTAGFLAAAVSGYACIHFLLTWLRSHSLYVFAAYCAGLSIISAAILLLR